MGTTSEGVTKRVETLCLASDLLKDVPCTIVLKTLCKPTHFKFGKRYTFNKYNSSTTELRAVYNEQCSVTVM